MTRDSVSFNNGVEVLAMFSNPSVNPALSQILDLDLGFCKAE